MTDQTQGPRLARDVVLYTLARIVLVAVITAAVIGVGRLFSTSVPLLVALLFAVVTAMPLSMVVFKALRTRVAAGIAVVDEQRRREKTELRARLRGDQAVE